MFNIYIYILIKKSLKVNFNNYLCIRVYIRSDSEIVFEGLQIFKIE